MPRLDPYESLGFHCNLTFRSFARALEERLRGTGVSQAQFLALVHLIALGPLAQVELAERLSIAPPTVARLVDRMERDGWVVREPDPGDGRRNRVVPTHRAEEIWEEVSQVGRDILERAYRGVHPAEIETVKRVLAKVRTNLEE
ncbi:MAG: MarR family transcriptional regulator [Deferrisomatales bacterium]